MFKKLISFEQKSLRVAASIVVWAVCTPLFAQPVAAPAPATGHPSLTRPVEEWQDFAETPEVTPAPERVNVVFMREANAVQGKAVNVFVNGEYFTSLLPGGYKSTYICSGRNGFSAQPTDESVASRYLEKQTPHYLFDLEGGQIRYFAIVADANGHPVAQSVPEGRARSMLTQLKEQNHAISRIKKNSACLPKARTVVVPHTTAPQPATQ